MPWQLRTLPQAMPFDIPFIGDDLAKIGRAIDLYSSPCSPTAEIWVYGFFQAVPTLFISLLKPELIDINIRHRHGRPRKGKRLRFIASAVFRDAIIEIPVPRWAVFRIYEWTQRIGWYLLVADATEQFAINWMSLAYAYGGCKSGFIAYSHESCTNTQQGSGAPMDSPLLGVLDETLNFNYPITGSQPTIDGDFRATVALSFAPYGDPTQSAFPTHYYLAIDGVRAGPNHVVYESQGSSRASSGSDLILVSGAPRPAFSIRLVWDQANKFCYATGKVTYDKVNQAELEPDP